MTEPVKAYSYLRISSDQQKLGDGVRRQLEMSRTYAVRHGYNLVEQMSDIGISAFKGKNIKDGALGVFIEAIDQGKIQAGSVLLVESLDRLSRDSVLTAFGQFSSILAKGIEIVTLTDEQHYTAESVNRNVGQLFTSLGIMLRANDESVTKSKRAKAAWNKKRQDLGTKILTAKVPAWLYLNDDRSEILVDEAKAKTVRHIFALSLKGMGTFSITRNLNENQAKYPPITNADNWNISYINNIVRNKAVIGIFQPKQRSQNRAVPAGDPVIGYYPSIIDIDTFNLVQSRLGRKTVRAGRKGNTFSNLFTGLTVCGKCGAAVGMKNKGAPPKGYKYLRCNNSLANHKGCDSPAWRYEEFEASFMKFVSEVKFSGLLNDGPAEKENLEGQRATVQEKLATLNVAYNALTSRFENPDMPDKLMDTLIKRSVQIEQDISIEEKVLQEIQQKIIERSHENIDEDQGNFIKAYKAISKIDDQAQLQEIRYSMHGLLKRSIQYIRIYNDFTINPWEVTENISNALRKSMGGKTDEELEDYFSKPHGKRLYTESERFFVVKFKSGAIRAVQPFENKTFMSISERLAKMRNSSRSLSG